jgi:hypothetical protein
MLATDRYSQLGEKHSIGVWDFGTIDVVDPETHEGARTIVCMD